MNCEGLRVYLASLGLCLVQCLRTAVSFIVSGFRGVEGRKVNPVLVAGSRSYFFCIFA